MRDHVDFANDRNQPNEFLNNVKPIFRVVKRRPRRMILLIDRSVSSYELIERRLALKRVAENFLLIVTFLKLCFI